MKRFLFTIAIAAAVVVPTLAAADVGVSLSLGQPGFYGQIDLGNLGPPPVVYARPVIISREPPGAVIEPLYLHVPSNHARNWRRYCGRYDACGRQVYFVKDDWYNKVYVPHYRDEHRDEHRSDHRDEHRDYNDHHDRDDHHDDHRDNH
jgi:hypothetical protein